MKNLYRIGIFVAVCIITGVLVIYLFDQFVLGIKDIGGDLPPVFEEQAELEANQERRAGEQQNMGQVSRETTDRAGGIRSGAAQGADVVWNELLDSDAEWNWAMDGGAAWRGTTGGTGNEMSGIPAYGEDASGDVQGSTQAVHTENTDAVITKTTVYEIEEYHRHTHEVNLVTERIPAQYIGMDRQDLESALALYLEAPSLRDVERGLQDIRLVRFSTERITVRKSYELNPEYDYYYLTEEQGYVVVYYRNMGTLFCETGIEIDDLPERLQREIRRIKTIETEEELYGFLESYSS